MCSACGREGGRRAHVLVHARRKGGAGSVAARGSSVVPFPRPGHHPGMPLDFEARLGPELPSPIQRRGSEGGRKRGRATRDCVGTREPRAGAEAHLHSLARLVIDEGVGEGPVMPAPRSRVALSPCVCRHALLSCPLASCLRRPVASRCMRPAVCTEGLILLLHKHPPFCVQTRRNGFFSARAHSMRNLVIAFTARAPAEAHRISVKNPSTRRSYCDISVGAQV